MRNFEVIPSGRHLDLSLDEGLYQAAARPRPCSTCCQPCRRPPRRKVLDPRRPGWLRWSGWDPWKRTVVLVHGFNGGHEKAARLQVTGASCTPTQLAYFEECGRRVEGIVLRSAATPPPRIEMQA